MRLAIKWILISLAAATATGGEAATADEAATAGEIVSVEEASGQTISTAALRKWSADRIIVDQAGTPREMPIDDILSLAFGRTPIPLAGGSPLVILASGDRLVARPVGVFDDELTATWHTIPSRPALKLPLETVSAIVFDLPTTADDRRRLHAELQTLPPGDDVVLLANGDRVQGEFERLDGAFAELKTPAGTLKLDRSRVQAIRLNPELTITVPMPGRRQALSLRDGSRVTARRVELLDRELKVTTFTKQEFLVPVSEIASVKVYGARAIPLSERQPAQVTFVPYLSHPWPLVRNANVLHGPLSLRGVEFGTGLGVHSRMLLTYDLQPEDLEFRAIVGIDDAAAGAGSARFAVELDGRKVWESQELTGRSPATPVPPVTLGSAKKLTLIVDFGANADIADYADWCDAIVVRRR